MTSKSNKHADQKATILAVCLAIIGISIGGAYGQMPECPFDREHPTLSSAYQLLNALNYLCAREELTAMLAIDSLAPEVRADVHMIIASINYVLLMETGNKQRTEVTQEMIEALRVNPEWNGTLEFDCPELQKWLAESRTKVAAELMEPDSTAKAPDTATAPIQKRKWWKSKWLLGGIGVVAAGTVTAIIAGGSDHTINPDSTVDPIPPFPNPPQRRGR